MSERERKVLVIPGDRTAETDLMRLLLPLLVPFRCGAELSTEGYGVTAVVERRRFDLGLPIGVKQPEAVKMFLGVLGSKEGQEAFNILKGSICARKDCDYTAFDAYLQSSAADWQVDTIVPSVVHGAAASEGWTTGYVDAVGAFVTSGDVAGTAGSPSCRMPGRRRL